MIAGRYRLTERLGRGGMSVVWRADDDVLRRPVAIKVLSAELAGNPELREQIHAEARAAAGLRHPHVVAVYDYGEFFDAGRLLSYVVMEVIEGRSLAAMLTAGALPWRSAVNVGAQVAAALAAAHAAGIVHRDIKPANVMVTDEGVKLVDFGISAAVGALDDQDGLLLGTPAYLAPERIEGAPVRPAADVYALGLLLYRALSGQMPWNAPTVTQMLKAHFYHPPAPMPPVPGLPADATRLITRCLSKNPADRPTATEAAQALAKIADRPPTSNRRKLATTTAAAALVLALGGTWWALSGQTPTPAAAAWHPAAPATPTHATAVPTSSPARPVTVSAVHRHVEPRQKLQKPEPPGQAKGRGPKPKKPEPPGQAKKK